MPGGPVFQPIKHNPGSGKWSYKAPSKKNELFSGFEVSKANTSGPRVKSKLPIQSLIFSATVAVFAALALLFGYLLLSGKLQPLLKTLSHIPADFKDWVKETLPSIAFWLYDNLPGVMNQLSRLASRLPFTT